MSEDKKFKKLDNENSRSDDFDKKMTAEEEVISTIKELLVKTTDEVFDKLGYKKIDPEEKYQGVYGNEEKYGIGSDNYKYTVKLGGKTKSNIEKITTFGAKRMQADVNIVFKDNIVEIAYKTPENGFFRGIDKNGKSLMVKEKKSFNTSDKQNMKKEMKEFFKQTSEKEVKYLTDTKLGVEDKSDASTASIVENSLPKNDNFLFEKMNLKEFFEDELSEECECDDKPETDADVKKDTNTVSIDSKKPENKNKKMFFDSSKPKENKPISEDNLKEITTSGPTASGAGSFLTPKFLKSPYAQNQKNKRPKVDRTYNVIPEKKSANESQWHTVKVDPKTHPLGMPFVKPNSNDELKKSIEGDKNKLKRIGLNETESQAPIKRKFLSELENKKLGVNKRYLITEKTSEEYEKERWKKLNNFKLYETILKKEDENIDLNTDSTFIEPPTGAFSPSDEIAFHEKNKMDKNPIETTDSLSSVVPDSNTITPSIPFAKDFDTNNFDGHSNGDDEFEGGDDDNGVLYEETIEVEKQNLHSVVKQKFYKKDFLNEHMTYILDLNSLTYVRHPNGKKLDEIPNNKRKRD